MLFICVNNPSYFFLNLTISKKYAMINIQIIIGGRILVTSKIQAVLRQIDLQALSDEELSSLYSLLSEYESTVKWALSCRKHYKTHSSSKRDNC